MTRRRPMSHPFAPALALAALLLAAAPALAATRLGTNDAETLVGTNGPDRITGGGGDTLKGLAGDDLYYFDDGWGTDTLSDKATYTVRGETRPGGVDTLDVSGVTAQSVQVFLAPTWGADSNFAVGNASGRVKLGASKIENVTGTPNTGSSDTLSGGGARNRLDTGGGGADELFDYGGWDDATGASSKLPESDDVFAGVAANTGTVRLFVWGGTDVLDLRPLSWAQVFARRFDADSNGTKESLQIVTGTNGQVVVYGHFGAYWNYATTYGQRGTIEQIRFADVTIGPTGAQNLGAASESVGGQNPKLARAADRLLTDAQRPPTSPPRPAAPGA